MLSVSALNEQIKSLLEATFISIHVQGEVSRPTYHSSGHLYFTLKDETSSINCVMFKGNNQKLKFTVTESMAVVIYGFISVYAPQGKYQINCFSLEPDGSGALGVAYEQLKKKLMQKGYFDESRKKDLPKFPKHIAIITSKTAAALEDMKKIANKRWSLVKLTLCEALMQGKGSKESISRAIKEADCLNADVIVIGRGGGSVEDLWSFNEEIVADTIFNATTPIVSAIGHEIDYVISDFVADARAATPSAAMELLLPDQNEVKIYLDDLIEQINNKFFNIINSKKEKLNFLFSLFKEKDFTTKYKLQQESINALKSQFNRTMEVISDKKKQEILFLQLKLNTLFEKNISNKEALLYSIAFAYKGKNPTDELEQGYVQITKDEKKIKLSTLKKDDEVELWSKEVILSAKITSLKKLISLKP